MKILWVIFRLAGIIGLGFFPALSFATVMTDCPGAACSLQDLLNGSTITINDKRFDSWQLFNEATTVGLLPDYSLVSVNPIGAPLNPGLSFALNGQMSLTNAPGGDFTAFEFGYRVQTMGNVTRIEDTSLQLGGFNLSGAGGLWRASRKPSTKVGFLPPRRPRSAGFLQCICRQHRRRRHEVLRLCRFSTRQRAVR